MTTAKGKSCEGFLQSVLAEIKVEEEIEFGKASGKMTKQAARPPDFYGAGSSSGKHNEIRYKRLPGIPKKQTLDDSDSEEGVITGRKPPPKSTKGAAAKKATRPVAGRKSKSAMDLDLEKAYSEAPSRRSTIHIPPEKDEQLVQYPPEGPGAISIFKSDEVKLTDGEFLNDTIIEFALKYIHRNLEEDEKTRATAQDILVFSSFFYKRLTNVKNKSERELGYNQVRKWTKGRTVFDKKYIVVPINENLHWYLAIVINPGAILTAKAAREEPLGEPPADERDSPRLPEDDIADNGLAQAAKARQKRSVPESDHEDEGQREGRAMSANAALPDPSADQSHQRATTGGDDAGPGIGDDDSEAGIDRSIPLPHNGFSRAPEAEAEASGADAAARDRHDDEEFDELDDDSDDPAGMEVDRALGSKEAKHDESRPVGIEHLTSGVEDVALKSPVMRSPRSLQPMDFDNVLTRASKYASGPMDVEKTSTTAEMSGNRKSGTKPSTAESIRETPPVVASDDDVHGNAGQGRLVGGGESGIVPGQALLSQQSKATEAAEAAEAAPVAESVGTEEAAGNAQGEGPAEGSMKNADNSVRESDEPTIAEESTAKPKPARRSSRFQGDSKHGRDESEIAEGEAAQRASKRAKASDKSTSEMSKKHREATRKLQQTDKPLVVTFDSLRTSRVGHVKVMRELSFWLRSEAKDKFGVEIDPDLDCEHLEASVPQQPNFWDCGIYVIHFFERFASDPKEALDELVSAKGGKEKIDCSVEC